jgi:hypothetical protein
MINWIIGLLETLVLDLLGGQALLELFDQYFLSQSSLNQVVLLWGVIALTALGLVSLVRYILKKTRGIITILLIGAVVYYLVVVVFDIDLLSIIR